MAGTPERKVKRMQAGRAFLAAGAAAVAALAAQASTNRTLSMSESPFQTLHTSLQSPIALFIGVFATITALMLLSGVELSTFSRRASYAVIVMGLLLSASGLMHALHR